MLSYLSCSCQMTTFQSLTHFKSVSAMFWVMNCFPHFDLLMIYCLPLAMFLIVVRVNKLQVATVQTFGARNRQPNYSHSFHIPMVMMKFHSAFFPETLQCGMDSRVITINLTSSIRRSIYLSDISS